MKFERREYQEKSINEALRELHFSSKALLVLPTGAGKAFILAQIARIVMEKFTKTRILVIVDREKLVLQLVAEFLKICPFPCVPACKGVNKKIDWSGQLIIGTRHTIHKNLDRLQRVDLLVADEAHRWNLRPVNGPPVDDFGRIYDRCGEHNQNFRFLGCTATPYSLKYGYIFGQRCKPGWKTYFDSITYHVGYSELFDRGYLVKPTFKICAGPSEADWSTIKKNSTGDFNLVDLSNFSCRHVSSVQQAITEHCQGFKFILVFACTIEHAEKIQEAVQGSVLVHSGLPGNTGAENLAAFEAAEYRVAVAVEQLCFGYDFRPADCVIMARKSNATELVIQMIGRPLRTSPGKKGALIIDLVGNVAHHLLDNDLDKPRVKVPTTKGKGAAPVKECPGTHKGSPCPETSLHPAVTVCPTCGYAWTREQIAALLPELLTFEHGEKNPLIMLNLLEWSCKIHTAKTTGKKTLKVTLLTDSLSANTAKINMFFMFNDHYEGSGIIKKCEKDWLFLGGTYYPDRVEEAEFTFSDLTLPAGVEIKKNQEGYFNVARIIK